MNTQTFNNDPELGGFRGVEIKGDSCASGRASRTTRPVRAHNAVDKRGLGFGEFTRLLSLTGGDAHHALQIAKATSKDARVINAMKAAVSAADTVSPNWGGNLVPEAQLLMNEFVEYASAQTILGRFGKNGIPALRKIPFNVSIPVQLSPGQGYWVGEGKAKPLTSWDYSRISHGWAKVANIAVITDELSRFTGEVADALVRDELARSLGARLDLDFIDPNKAAIPDESPASITHGVTPLVSSGTDVEAVRTDIKRVMAKYLAVHSAPTTGVWIMPTVVALSLSLMTTALDEPAFPTVNMFGGTLFGLPIITSDWVPAGTVVMCNAQDIFVSDDGLVNVSTSREASLEMDSAPNHNSTGPVGANLVSMWQTNSIAVRAERYINWSKRRAEAVVVLDDVAWGGDIALS